MFLNVGFVSVFDTAIDRVFAFALFAFGSGGNFDFSLVMFMLIMGLCLSLWLLGTVGIIFGMSFLSRRVKEVALTRYW